MERAVRKKNALKMQMVLLKQKVATKQKVGQKHHHHFAKTEVLINFPSRSFCIRDFCRSFISYFSSSYLGYIYVAGTVLIIVPFLVTWIDEYHHYPGQNYTRQNLTRKVLCSLFFRNASISCFLKVFFEGSREILWLEGKENFLHLFFIF